MAEQNELNSGASAFLSEGLLSAPCVGDLLLSWFLCSFRGSHSRWLCSSGGYALESSRSFPGQNLPWVFLFSINIPSGDCIRVLRFLSCSCSDVNQLLCSIPVTGEPWQCFLGSADLLWLL